MPDQTNQSDQFAKGKELLTPGMSAIKEMQLTPQEQSFYQRHLTNLQGSGGVDNPPTAEHPEGSRSTLYQTSAEIEGKTYNLPTVWDGKILTEDQAIERAKQEGLDKFPSYGSEQEAESRYQQMHTYMEKDMQLYLMQKQQEQNKVMLNDLKTFLNAHGMPTDLEEILSGKYPLGVAAVGKLLGELAKQRQQQPQQTEQK